MPDPHGQAGYRVRHGWGLAGALAVCGGGDAVSVGGDAVPGGGDAVSAGGDAVSVGGDVPARAVAAVVVDVLSFTTTLSVAADRGVAVLPCDRADRTFAARHDAVLAVRRSVAGAGDLSLSPVSVRAADPPPTRLVLPSPNGSSLAAGVASRVPVVVGACLRNAPAVAAWLVRSLGPAARVAVLSAGERWPDGSLRPCVEDLWGAGAVVEALLGAGWAGASPEALAAAFAYRALQGEVLSSLLECGSGRELVDAGYREDVVIAAEVGSSDAVPLMVDGAFVAAGGG